MLSEVGHSCQQAPEDCSMQQSSDECEQEILPFLHIESNRCQTFAAPLHAMWP